MKDMLLICENIKAWYNDVRKLAEKPKNTCQRGIIMKCILNKFLHVIINSCTNSMQFLQSVRV